MAGVERVYSVSGSVNAVPGTTGPAGKSAYAYAVEGGYEGTEEEFAAKLAEELPEALPNPQALTFTGAATGTYDGGEAVEIEIPSGGGSNEWRKIGTVAIADGEEVTEILIDVDENGDAFSLDDAVIIYSLVRGASSTTTNGVVRIWPFKNWDMSIQGVTVANDATTAIFKVAQYHFVVDLSPKFNMWGNVAGGNNYIYPTRKAANANTNPDMKIDRIKFSFSVDTETFGVGTTVEVWGR